MAKKDEMKIDVPLDNVKAKLQLARVMLQEKNLKKTGDNKFANFMFFQLEDFLPKVNEIFAKLGLHSEFSITPEIIAYEETININGENKIVTKKPIIKEMATLIITDILKPDDIEVYEMEVAPLERGSNTKQNTYQAAGGRNTYYKRYLYMNALEIVEDDESDTVLGQENVNYQQVQPNVSPYDFIPQQPAQPVMQAVPQNNNLGQNSAMVTKPVQNQFVANSEQPIKVTTEQGYWEPQQLENVATNLESTVNTLVNEKEPLSTESKMEIMNLVNQKGLNGASIIADFCKQNGLTGTNDLLEAHKQALIDMVNSK